MTPDNSPDARIFRLEQEVTRLAAIVKRITIDARGAVTPIPFSASLQKLTSHKGKPHVD
jgi:hypothetical protein